MSQNRHLEGAFATGHTAFEGAAQAAFYTQTLTHEFDEEYKQVHEMRKPSGPGRMEMPEWQKKRRAPIDLPLTGTDIHTRQGGAGEQAYAAGSPCMNARSSNVIGGFWNDPIFQNPPGLVEKPVESIGTLTSRELGRFTHDRDLFPPEQHRPRTDKNRSSGFTKQLASSFALEDLPVADRML
jgi:hypothetical protein